MSLAAVRARVSEELQSFQIRDIFHKYPKEWAKEIELVATVALGIFAACVAPQTLLIWASIGAVYQVVLIATGVTTLDDGKEEKCHTSVNCGQSDGERYAGRRLTPLEYLLIPVVYFALHMRHEPEDYVPLLGLYIGTRAVWLGYTYYHQWNAGPNPSAQKHTDTCCHTAVSS